MDGGLQVMVMVRLVMAMDMVMVRFMVKLVKLVMEHVCSSHGIPRWDGTSPFCRGACSR